MTSHTTAQSWFEWRELRQQDAGFNNVGGGRLSVDREGRDGLNSPKRELSFFRSAPQAARSILFFGTGEKGNRLKLSVNESKFE